MMDRSILRRDIGRKTVALVLAVLAWFALRLFLEADQPYEMAVRVAASTVEVDQYSGATGPKHPYIIVLPPTLTVFEGERASAARLILRGAKQSLLGFEFRATVNIPPDYCGDADSRPFVLDASVITSTPPLPPAMQLTLEPKEILIHRADTVEVDLTGDHLVIEGNPHRDWMWEKSAERISFSPRSIQLLGPRREIETIRNNPSALKLQPLDIEGRRGRVEQVVELDRAALVKLELEHVSMHQVGRGVTVSVDLQQKEENKVINQVKIHAINVKWFEDTHGSLDKLDPPLETWDANVTVAARPGFWLVNRPENLREKVLLFVDLKQLGAGHTAGELTIYQSYFSTNEASVWPDGVKIHSLKPDRIIVTLSDTPAEDGKADSNGG